jgi:hypothetical protein
MLAEGDRYRLLGESRINRKHQGRHRGCLRGCVQAAQAHHIPDGQPADSQGEQMPASRVPRNGAVT